MTITRRKGQRLHAVIALIARMLLFSNHEMFLQQKVESMITRVFGLVLLVTLLSGCGSATPPTGSLDATPNALAATPNALAATPNALVETVTPGSAEVSRTEVIRYVPTVLPTEARSGSCWGPSIAVYRDGAYRCMVDNGIFDPCFAVDGSPNVVVCEPDPTTDYAGIRLDLSEPLPALTPVPEPADTAWLVELPSGMTCKPFTGTLGEVNQQLITYHCAGRYDEEQTVLLGDLTMGDRWTAEQAILLPGNPQPQLKQSERVVLRRVWQ